MNEREFVAGLDLGQARDYTALVLLERLPAFADEDEEPNEEPERRPEAGTRYQVQYIQRWPLNTSYPDVADGVAAFLSEPVLCETTSLVVDRTGVGVAVFDLLRTRGLSPNGIVITAGDAPTTDELGDRVPKYDLIGAAVVAAQTGRLRIPKKVQFSGVLREELEAFERRIKSEAFGGHEVFGAKPGAHDDIVLALCLACWFGEAHPPLRMWGAGPVLEPSRLSHFGGPRKPDWWPD